MNITTITGGGAPRSAPYVVIASGDVAGLDAERIFQEGTNIDFGDFGPNGPLQISVSPQGAGSALDSDTVDGQHASSFSATSHGHNIGQITGGSLRSFAFHNASGTIGTTAEALDGEILIGASGTNPVKATLTQGSGISVVNGPGSILITNTSLSVTDHGALTGLTGTDHHTQYALRAGRAGSTNDLTLSSDGTGVLYGSAAAGGVDVKRLRITSTSHTTKGVLTLGGDGTKIEFQDGNTWSSQVKADNTFQFLAAPACRVMASTTDAGGGEFAAFEAVYAAGATGVRMRANINAAGAFGLSLWTEVACFGSSGNAAGLALGTVNATPVAFATNNIVRGYILATSNTLQGNAGFTLEGGAGAHTLTLRGGATQTTQIALAADVTVAGNVVMSTAGSTLIVGGATAVGTRRLTVQSDLIKTDATGRALLSLKSSETFGDTNPNVLEIVVTGAATQATRIWDVQTGESGVANGGRLRLQDGGGDVRICGATGKIGFYGVAEVARSMDWAFSNVTADKTFDANATTLDEIADVLGTLLNTLKAIGILG